MRALIIHTVVYVVVMALLTGAWLLTTGSSAELELVRDDPAQGVKDGFWPLLVGALWGGALVIHAAAWLTTLLPGGRRRKRKATHSHGPRPPATPPTPALSDIPVVGADLAKDAARAAIGLVESFAGRSASRPSTPASATPGRRWVVVMFTDLVDSTRLAERLGDTTWHEVLANHRQLVRGRRPPPRRGGRHPGRRVPRPLRHP